MTFRRFPRIVYLWLVLALVAAPSFLPRPLPKDPSFLPRFNPQISLSVTNPIVGQALDVEITVRNQGDATAGFYRVYLYIDQVDAPPTATTRDTTYYGYPGLAEGISQSWAYTNYRIRDPEAFTPSMLGWIGITKWLGNVTRPITWSA